MIAFLLLMFLFMLVFAVLAWADARLAARLDDWIRESESRD